MFFLYHNLVFLYASHSNASHFPFTSLQWTGKKTRQLELMEWTEFWAIFHSSTYCLCHSNYSFASEQRWCHFILFLPSMLKHTQHTGISEYPVNGRLVWLHSLYRFSCSSFVLCRKCIREQRYEIRNNNTGTSALIPRHVWIHSIFRVNWFPPGPVLFVLTYIHLVANVSIKAIYWAFRLFLYRLHLFPPRLHCT